MDSYKGILYLYFFEMTGKEIYDYLHDKRFEKSELPLYTVNDKGKVVYFEDWFQFIMPGGENGIGFFYKSGDAVIEEEISQTGIDEMFEGFDFIDYKDKVILNDYNRRIPSPTLMDVTIKWWKDEYNDDWDAETIIDWHKEYDNGYDYVCDSCEFNCKIKSFGRKPYNCMEGFYDLNWRKI